MKSGVPMIWPVTVSRDASTARAIPKSITRGPPGESSTLAGFRSRWTSPAAWIAASASASPRARSSSACSGIGPWVSTASRSDGPSTNSVASHGGSPSGSASSTRAVNRPTTAEAAATSRRNRCRNPVSSARSSRITLTAARRPSGRGRGVHPTHAADAQPPDDAEATDQRRVVGL